MWKIVPSTCPNLVATDCSNASRTISVRMWSARENPRTARGSLVADGAEVGLAVADRQVGDVGRPELVDAVGMELPIHQVRGVGGGWIGDGGDLEQARADAGDAEAGHAGSATVLWLTRSPASWRSRVIRGAP